MSDPRPTPPSVQRWSERETIEQASRAVGRVLRDDMRGMTTLSIDDIAAMTWTLLAFGLVPTAPGEAAPAQLIFTPIHPEAKEAADGQ